MRDLNKLREWSHQYYLLHKDKILRLGREWTLAHPKETDRKRHKWQLSDRYITFLLRDAVHGQKLGLIFPAELIEQKRRQLLLLRQAKEILKEAKHGKES